MRGGQRAATLQDGIRTELQLRNEVSLSPEKYDPRRGVQLKRRLVHIHRLLFYSEYKTALCSAWILLINMLNCLLNLVENWNVEKLTRQTSSSWPNRVRAFWLSRRLTMESYKASIFPDGQQLTRQ